MRGGGLGCLGAEPRCLQLQGGRLLLDVRALLLAALLIGHPLTQVVLPVHVVDVDHLAHRVEVEHAVDGLADELDVVADDDQAALVVLQELAQPHDAVGVEVVRGLVEDHRLRVGEQDACELDAAALTARERLQRLVENTVGQRQVVGDRCRLRLGGVATERLETLCEVAVAAHRLRGDLLVGVAHLDRRLVHLEGESAEPAGVEDTGTREHLRVARTGVLRQVAEFAGALDLAVGGREVAGEHLRQRRLAGAVAPDEADLVAVRDAERHLRHERAGAHADLEVVHGEHSRRPFFGG